MQGFYIGAATVLPVLLLANGLQILAVKGPRKTGDEELAAASRAARRAIVVGVVLLGSLLTWAEWICLRSVKTGQAPFGAPTVVWIALVSLGGAITIAPIWSLRTADAPRPPS
jgi:hypothetical protein